MLVLLIWLCTVNYAAFGDSITTGYSASPGNSYVELLQNNLGPIDNRAVSGTKIPAMVEAIEAYTGTATTYFWLPGMNDMYTDTPLGEYEYWLRRGLDAAAGRGVKVYLGECLPLTENGYTLKGGSSERVEEMRELTREVLKDYPGAVYVSFPGYDPDVHIAGLIHPNDAGNRVIYEAFLGAVWGERVWLPILSE